MSVDFNQFKDNPNGTAVALLGITAALGGLCYTVHEFSNSKKDMELTYKDFGMSAKSKELESQRQQLENRIMELEIQQKISEYQAKINYENMYGPTSSTPSNQYIYNGRIDLDHYSKQMNKNMMFKGMQSNQAATMSAPASDVNSHSKTMVTEDSSNNLNEEAI